MVHDPKRDRLLPYGKQSLSLNDIEKVVDVLKSDFLTTGPKVDEFEGAVASKVGAKYAVSFSSGTAALHAACFVAGIGEGDEVITSPMTFIASANCVLYQNGTPIFADIDPVTYNIDPNEVEKRITKNTKAIIPVHFTGQPANLDAIRAIADKHELIVIEDAAHAIGATYKGEKIGGLSDMTMFSFHPVKHITTGEGGMITTDDETYYQQLKQFRSHGVTRDQHEMKEYHGPWYYEMQFLGYNYRMTDIQAALGLSQLSKLDDFIKRRREIVAIYNEAFQDIAEIVTPFVHHDVSSSWHLYVIQLNLANLTGTREAIFNALRTHNLGVNVHYIPVHMQPFYQQMGYRKGDYPVAESLYDAIITLPLFPAMTDGDAQDVIEIVRHVVQSFRK
ncbi:UDP-4-amino-4,6-dideoxy-N-acetyl-beta-L-altrosamine transaminase [Alkalibacillus almallahensis]|uniref:UDP-4-amino-4, 6-dideoxy-N-acetyl-beta-L-altrosamine transaminase n=1 Tax=Alkalibacillus almallahensis TaxID=1379154 RepID=UPI00141DD717|nr:UDP-4-amino-4,6-dideoxy-N-acetyl-beta-L-altrosamine transaminase [Alkalibacillus almallahensis]NIK12256.1 UDP-4-amino-4,6-dideoxy-N-acetyl-beta-L-altrosamine transaminase [Alkalibacillus almallahensis]